MAEADVKFLLGAIDAGFAEAMAKAKEQAKEASAGIKEHFESINGTFEKLGSAFMALTAIIAGGEAFKEMIQSTVNATVESMALGRQLGISATSASQLKVAMGSVFVTQDQVSGATNKITIALKKHESAFHDLGVATRDSNGHFRNSLEIMQATNEKLMEFKEGTDRNVEGVKIYGKGWGDAQATLKITSEVMEEARIKSDALGLTVGEKSVATTKRYRTAMHDLHEVIEAVGKVIAETVMPILSSLGEWFEHHGPEVVAAFRAALFTMEAVWISIKGVVVVWMDTVVGSILIAYAWVERFGKAVNALMTPGASVTDAWDKSTKKIKDSVASMTDTISMDMKQMAKDTADAFEASAADTTHTKTPGAGETSDGGDEKKARLLADLAGELEAKKAAYATDQAAHGSFIQFTLEQERAFWQSKTGLARAGSSEAVEIQKNIDKLTVSIAKEGYKESIEALKAQDAEYKNNLGAKLAIAQEMAAKIAQAEGTDSTQARQAAAAVVTIQRDMKVQQLAIDEAYVTASDNLELSKIDTAQREAQLQYKLGATTDDQMLAQENKFENDRYALKVAALQKKLDLLAQDPTENVAKIQQNLNEQLALETQHTAAVDALRIKSVEQSNAEWRSMFSTMQSGFARSLDSFLQGTQTLAGAIRGLFREVEKSVISTLANIMAQKAADAIKSMAIAKAERMASQEANAVKAGSAAWASAADIPVVGWVLGPIAGAAAYAGVMAMAEGGYDIPAGVNPVVQAHAQEMILPARHANVIRDLADGGGAAGGFSPSIHVSAMDGPSFVKWMNANAGAVSQSLRHLNNRFMATGQ